MTPEGLNKIMDSQLLSQGEKDYIFDEQYHNAGDFMIAIWEAIARADSGNLARLRSGFPEEVDAYIAWTQGDLYERASEIAGGDVGFIEETLIEAPSVLKEKK